jgi:hypothetical protein
MAKLEDQVTPIELLNIIRGGAIKKEVLKQFRTTEQELAKMLLPLYRSGELTMEEFNDFFKGLALKPQEGDKEGHGLPSAPRPEDEAPSEILRSLSEDRGRKMPEEASQAVPFPPETKLEKTPATEVSPEPPMASVESAIVEEIEAEELFEEGELEEEFVEEPDIEMEGELQPETDLKELKVALPLKPAPQPPPPEPAAPAPTPPPPMPRRAAAPPKPLVDKPTREADPATSDAAVVQKALNTIIAKLSSMEGLLARIEKNLRKP